METPEYKWSEETPFIMYEDEKGIRYIGPTGDTTMENFEDNAEPAESENQEYIRDKGELAPLGNTTFPSSVDLRL